MEVREVRAIDELESLAGDWEQLLQRLPSATPFQSPRWLIPWWRHLGEGELLVLTVWSELALVGVLPMFVYLERQAATRKLMLLGAGTSDYLDGVFAPEQAKAAAVAAFNHLRGTQEEWDICELCQLQTSSLLLSCAMPGGLCDQLTAGEICPVLDVPTSVERLERVIPTHQWEKLQYYRRRAARAGALEFVTATEENFHELFDSFVRLHRMRLDAQHKPTAMGAGSVQAFHHEAARALLRAGMLRLIVMNLDGRAVAAFYGFKAGRRTFFYLSGFDPACSQLSPGMLVVGAAIEQAVREGCYAFDFLRGQETYKYHWGALDSPTYRRAIGRRRMEAAFESATDPVNVVLGA